ncbi:MAG: DUF177 domain-containing protein [Gemmatimonadetes bacterium]|nr:DUF177 domain-containing protein [Gemmatimonadota bacterium]
MLTLDLVRLRQERTLPVEASVDADADLWAGSGLVFQGPIEIKAAAQVTADGGVLIRGQWDADVRYECGRCLDPLDVGGSRELSLLWMPADGWETDDPDVRTIGPGERTLDFAEAFREEVLLELPRYVLPEEDEEGRCSSCGKTTDGFRREGDQRGSDPRWAKLKALKSE